MSIVGREKIKKDFPFLAKVVRWMKMRRNELRALPRHIKRKLARNENARFHHGKIKVVFICQYIPAWSKNKCLYETLKKDNRFEAILLCIPNRIHANRLQDPNNLSNDTYEYFTDHGYNEAVNALSGKNMWVDLKTLRPDYVIYNRYDRPMPYVYTSSQVSQYAKVCLIIYGCALLKSEESMIDKTFSSNTFYFFAESEGIRNDFMHRNRLLNRFKLSSAVCCGITAVENAINAKNDDAPAWSFTDNDFRIMYTPRWTTASTWGGSTFQQYKDFFFQYADDNPTVAVLVRPHPLMFENFISSGILSKKEVEAYYNDCEKRENIRLDKEKEYLSSFWNTSVLVSDYSSMIIEYFATGKPLVYLTYNDSIDYTDQMQEMLDASYLVSDESQLRIVLDNLKLGIDPLKEKRSEVLKKVIQKDYNACASENIKNILIAGQKQ